MRYQAVFYFLACFGLCACKSLLPSGSVEVGAGFASFEDARLAAERIVPFKTRTVDLNGLGFDISAGQNVTLVSYPEIVVRLTPHPGVPISSLDSGVRKCIDVQLACRGFVFRFEREDRKREEKKPTGFNNPFAEQLANWKK